MDDYTREDRALPTDTLAFRSISYTHLKTNFNFCNDIQCHCSKDYTWTYYYDVTYGATIYAPMTGLHGWLLSIKYVLNHNCVRLTNRMLNNNSLLIIRVNARLVKSVNHDAVRQPTIDIELYIQLYNYNILLRTRTSQNITWLWIAFRLATYGTLQHDVWFTYLRIQDECMVQVYWYNITVVRGNRVVHLPSKTSVTWTNIW